VLVGRTEELMADMEPTALGVPRPGRHTGTTWWLHYDGQLMVVAAVMAAGEVVPPHNHGNWNVTGVWRGAVHYTGYHRRDDRSVDLVADLAVAERRVVRAGQAVFCPPPPDDIHEVVSLEEGTLTVLVAPPFADVREYYLPERGCYVRRRGGAEGPGVPAPPADGGAS
jgi:predicted metal-dependent enzyme (double-stranded beta helix superfamily)